MDQRSGIEGVSAGPPSTLGPGQGAKLVIDEGVKLVQRTAIP